MCDPCASAHSCVRYLLPLARDHLLPVARKYLFPLALDHLLPILKEAVNMIRGIPNDEIAHMKHELETIEEAIHQADKMADAEGDDQSHGTREKIKQLIEASFRIQDVIDKYIIREEQHLPDPGCVDAASDYAKTKILRLQIAHDIQNIKSRISEIKDTSSKKDHEASSSSATNPNATLLRNLQNAPLYMDEYDVVGFEVPRDKLVDCLVKGRDKLTVVSVVAMGGQGKTTLAKNVFDNNTVVKHFDCRVWITVSQPYKLEGLLKDLLHKLYKQMGRDPPPSIDQMDRDSLVYEVRTNLQQKRYVVVFDDVWNIHFWDEIQLAMIDKKNGSKILITTRNMDVAKKFSSVEVHELKSLTKEQSLDLFNKIAFSDLDGCCPENLIETSSKIVEKCNGLPLAIVVISGLLSFKNRNALELYKFNENIISSELKGRHSSISKILGHSYHDLSYNLKSCLLYFGIFPEDSELCPKPLIRQWIAEGFVKDDWGRTLEEVAEGYLTELIHRNLVQVVSVSVDGRTKYCRVHDLVHAMILEKFEDLSFCKTINVDGQSTLTGITRRLSITTNSDKLMESINSSHVRSLFYINSNLSESFVRKIPTKLLKVLVLKDDELLEVPEDFGSLIHLKYLELNGTFRKNCYVIPISIGMVENLETLDLRFAFSCKMPKEICKLRKLRHLIGNNITLSGLKDDIGGLTSLQTLRGIYLYEYEDYEDDDNRVTDLIQELGKLKQLRELALSGVKTSYMSVLSSSINKMQLLEKLFIESFDEYTFIDMHLNSPPPMLRHLKLIGRLEKLPEWIPKLKNLVKLKLKHSDLKHDAMELLKSMTNLLTLSLRKNAFGDKRIHFQDGWFKNLKVLILALLFCVESIHIDEGALPSLETFEFYHTQNVFPTGIQHLKKLKLKDVSFLSKA
ncbi:hypothetical protein TSUD_153320 [Trifolium subterraneum]|uniref:NB-ARC domain-containing protein n=1 Tax=Trifolium subterraneum TaxID=3900 RepID=A0A2Z6MXM7_TRISU|nr:hypothetical protein TSUD_153320 [Trifolium subterraneum]